MFVGEIIFRTVATQYAAWGTVSPVLAGFCRFLRQLSAQKSSRHFHCIPSGLSSSERNRIPPSKTSWITEDLLEQSAGSSFTDNGRGQNNQRAPRVSFQNAEFDKMRDYKKSHSPGRGVESKGKSNRRNAGAEGDDIVFGTNPVLLALRQRRRSFFRLFITEAKSLSQEPQVQEILKICRQLEIPVLQKEAAQLAKLSENRPHQGICLDSTMLMPTPLDISLLKTEICPDENRKPLLWLFLDSVMDPMNFGAILRSAYFFGVDKLIIFNSCPLTSTVSKASAGVMEVIPIFSMETAGKKLQEFFKIMKENGWSIVATGSKNEVALVTDKIKRRTIQSLTADGDILLIIGNEHSGVNGDVLRFCDQMVNIEAGKEEDLLEDANCLNVSVATGVILSHIVLKQKREKNIGVVFQK